MYFKSTNVSGLFDSTPPHFIILVYKRAYSWETEHLEVDKMLAVNRIDLFRKVGRRFEKFNTP